MVKKIWVVDDDESMGWIIEKALVKSGYDVTLFSLPKDLVSDLHEQDPENRPNLIVSDIRMPGMNGFDLLSFVNEMDTPIPVIIMTAFGDLDSAVDSFNYGAYEYLTKPFDLKDLTSIVKKSLAETAQPEKGGVSADGQSVHGLFLGQSAPVQSLFRIIGRISGSTAPVLIHGEPGSGKGLIAQAVHGSSVRSEQPLICFTPGLVPDDLIDQTLFGRELGASPDLPDTELGVVLEANKGTLFIDGIDDLTLDVQHKLANVLNHKSFYRIGAEKPLDVDIRLIASTRQDLENWVEQGKFSKDLFYLISQIPLEAPKLADRTDDIPILFDSFLAKAAKEIGGEPRKYQKDVLRAMTVYHWPGNVRELESLAWQLSTGGLGETIAVADLPHKIAKELRRADLRGWRGLLQKEIEEAIEQGQTGLIQYFGAHFEKTLMNAALEHTNGHKINASRVLGWGRNTLARKLETHRDL